MNRGATSTICLPWVEQKSWLSKSSPTDLSSILKVVRRRTKSCPTYSACALSSSTMDSFPPSYRNSTCRLLLPSLLQFFNAFRLRSGCLRGHLRLTAATALLKLAILADNEKEISNSAFETVAYVVQVSMASSSKRQSTY